MRHEWLEYIQNLGWDNPITVAMTSAAVSTVITLAWIAALNARRRKRQRRDTALELALSLEGHARACRTMMHKAAWALTASANLTGHEPLKGVTIPSFAFPDNLDWQVLNRKAVSELREYPATLHAAREHVEAFREFGEPADFCWQVEFECAKAAMSALVLAHATRRRFGAATWKPGARDASLERELCDFIANAEARRKVSLQEPKQFAFEGRLGADQGVARTIEIAGGAAP
ncbi:hypothetical protein PPMP20_17185 [Paraburkholderia phymatum]|uniref:Transmembrane protein n=1 Tax=Paraburkholderia phymatum (strain DSM 17167 / CIP 108236 / LMG 21445 / STM815) TaxID=391038 RepID=B2JTA0_PARP8|nr:hypothetical protein [Paraburkholderia phymatum]ACC75803.1 hypothetical protein Bphy_6782 [Paraburkholderia phymatum STM815]